MNCPNSNRLSLISFTMKFQSGIKFVLLRQPELHFHFSKTTTDILNNYAKLDAQLFGNNIKVK